VSLANRPTAIASDTRREEIFCMFVWLPLG
jgi:hypothetical protein